MQNKTDIIKLIFDAIETINNSLDDKLEKSPETSLYGRDSKLDSLGLVNLIVEVEESITDKFNRTITIADEKALSQKNSPFRTVETLANYVCSLLEENEDG